MAFAASRADDDRALWMLARRRGGATTEAIGRACGVSRARVAQITDAVRAADLAESGEQPDDVAAAYWPVRQGRRGDAGR